MANTTTTLSKPDFETLTTNYNKNTVDILAVHKTYKIQKEVLDFYNNQVSKNHNNLSEIKDENVTNKRLVEININKSRKINYILYMLKICLIVIGCLVVFPLLCKLGILDKMTSVIVWAICNIIILLVILYILYIKNYNREPNNFNKFSFINPTDDEVNKSKLNLEISETDKARCQAFAESELEYDTSNIDNSLFDKYKTAHQEKDLKCSV